MALSGDTCEVALIFVHDMASVLVARGKGAPSVVAPRILVAGLNPHAGEGGHLGREEIEVLGPTIARLRRSGLTLVGPLPADTAFLPERTAVVDAVLAMYHDQGLIPEKLLGVEHGVNTTLGLPFVRTSPDHGTAFDIAGRGLADPRSLLAAWRLAARLAVHPAA